MTTAATLRAFVVAGPGWAASCGHVTHLHHHAQVPDVRPLRFHDLQEDPVQLGPLEVGRHAAEGGASPPPGPAPVALLLGTRLRLCPQGQGSGVRPEDLWRGDDIAGVSVT